VRSAGTHEGWVSPAPGGPLERITNGPLVYVVNATHRPWPMDVVEPVAWKVVEDRAPGGEG
jgi:hypothetical protein